MNKFWIIILCLLTACGVTEQGQSGEQIVCTVAYRSSVSVAIEREETLTFTNSRGEQLLMFDEATFHAAFDTGEQGGERSLRLWVTDTIENSAIYQSHLYQLDANSFPTNQFAGDHGFTGLHYSYPRGDSAELQYWCSTR